MKEKWCFLINCNLKKTKNGTSSHHFSITKKGDGDEN